MPADSQNVGRPDHHADGPRGRGRHAARLRARRRRLRDEAVQPAGAAGESEAAAREPGAPSGPILCGRLLETARRASAFSVPDRDGGGRSDRPDPYGIRNSRASDAKPRHRRDKGAAHSENLGIRVRWGRPDDQHAHSQFASQARGKIVANRNRRPCRIQVWGRTMGSASSGSCSG